MASTKAVIAAMFIILCDAAISFLLFIHGVQLQNFFEELVEFSIKSSLFDLWIISLIRVCVVLGSSFGVLHNYKDGPVRVRKSKTAIVILSGTMVIYAIVKLLLRSELPHWYKDIWFWGLLAWTVVSSLMMVGCWKLLGMVKPRSKQMVLVVNSETDQEHLVSESTPEEDGSEGDEDAEEKKEIGSRATFLKLLAYSKPDIPYISIGFAALLVSSASNIFLPLYTGRVIDGIVVEKDQSKFTEAIIIMSIISVVSALAGGLRGGMFTFTLGRLNYRVNNLLFKSILRQEVGFFDTNRTGNITSRLTSDTATMSESLSLNVNIFLRSIIEIIGYVVMMFGLSWRLTTLALVAIPLLAVMSDYYGDFYEKIAKEVQDSLAKANNVAEEAISTIRTVKSFANEDGEVQDYSAKLKETYKLRVKMAWIYAGYILSNRFLDLMFDVSSLFYGGHLVLKGVITGGQLVSFILYSLELGGSLENIANVYTGLMEAAGSSVKVLEYINRKPKIENDGQEVPPDLKGHIEFKDVTFKYPARDDVTVLENVSFTACPGEVVALVGQSGGGKSTCVNLLQHFYEPDTGSVLLDGIPVNQLEHKYLHTQVAMVGQEPVLYARSIADNIRYGLTDCSQEHVEMAAQQANAHTFITELKDGYDTQTGEKGAQISGGQKQRVAIARALVRNPKVLLLDEATSALDAESEHLVQQALYKNSKDKTILIIAHRLSTVEKANKIVVIDQGKVLEQGSHQELLKKKGGMYAKLVQRQLLSVNDSDVPDETVDEDLICKSSDADSGGQSSKVGSEAHV